MINNDFKVWNCFEGLKDRWPLIWLRHKVISATCLLHSLQVVFNNLINPNIFLYCWIDSFERASIGIVVEQLAESSPSRENLVELDCLCAIILHVYTHDHSIR